MRPRCVATVVGVMMVVVSCGGGGTSDSAPTLPLAEPPDVDDIPATSDDLAPSQVTASTVVAPDTPGPCDLADLEFWTAQVSVGERSADALIRVRNTGDVWCEPDISGSPVIDSEIEPDVWLDPGGWADLIVGQSGRECFTPEIVSLAELDIDGEPVVVPTAAVATCGWELTAFYPIDVAVDPCGQIETSAVTGAVLVRNTSLVACRLGELVAVAGNDASTTPRVDGEAPMLVDLAGGDVVAFRFVVDGTIDCDQPEGSGAMTFELAGTAAVDDIRCGSVFELGPGRPWYGAVDGPLTAFSPDSFDLDEVLRALAPFTRSP